MYRVAQKECNTYGQSFQENEGQNENVVCIIVYVYKLFPQQDNTKIVNFDEGVLILWQCHFQDLPFYKIYVPKISYCLATPGKGSSFALAEPA